MTDQFCSACGESVEPGAQFCPHCGHRLGRGDAEQPATRPDATPAPRKRRNLLYAGIAVVVVIGLAVGLTLLLTRSSPKTGELFLETAASTGANPFTESTVTDTGSATTGPTTTTATSAPTTTPAGGQTVVGTVEGNTAGLYGGTLNGASCDREKQIAFLQANPDKAAAFAGVLGIRTDQVSDYLRGLTPVVLREDTRVTNHGFVDGAATSFQSVLQAGTAVLVDEYGIPRVR